MRKFLIAAALTLAVTGSLAGSRAEAMTPAPLTPPNIVDQVALCFYFDGWNGPRHVSVRLPPSSRPTAGTGRARSAATTTAVITTAGRRDVRAATPCRTASASRTAAISAASVGLEFEGPPDSAASAYASPYAAPARNRSCTWMMPTGLPASTANSAVTFIEFSKSSVSLIN